MNIKKVLNTALCAVIASGGVLTNAATPVMANWFDHEGTVINYEVTEKYTWSAPADIEFTTGTNGTEIKSGTVEVAENVIPDGSKLRIAVKSDQAFEMEDVANTTNKRTYFVKNAGEAVLAGTKVLEVESGTNSGSATLDFQMNSETVEIAGTYRGVMSFVSEIKEPDYILNDVDGDGLVSKGDIIKFASSYMYSGGNTGPTQFLVLNSDGDTAELFAKANYQNSVFNDSYDLKYEGSTLDTLLNETYYNTLSENIKGKIQLHSITQHSYRVGMHTGTYTVGTCDRNVYALDKQDVEDYLGTDYTPQQLNMMFFGTSSLDGNGNVWLRSYRSGFEEAPLAVCERYGDYSGYSYDSTVPEARPAFKIALDFMN